VNDPVSLQSTPFHTAIPSSSSLNEFWPESKQFVAVPHDLQRNIGSPISAIYVSFHLLMALCDSSRKKTQNYTGSPPFEQQYPWILEICEELWHYFRRWTTGSDKRPLSDETTTLYMELVDTLAIPASDSRYRFSSSDKAASASIISVSHLIESLATSPMTDINQIRLALVVTRLCHVAQAETQHRSVLDGQRRPPHLLDTEPLKQSAKRICEATEVFLGLQKDLQVCKIKHYTQHSTNVP
jgi:serine/threonine-protein kinase ATR